MRSPLRTSLLGLVLGLGALSLVACGDDDAASTATTVLSPSVTIDSSGAITLVGPAEAAALIEDEGDAVTVVDVRTPDEFATGHLEGAINLDVQAADFDDQLAQLDPDGTYVVYCRSGNRSAQAAVRMAAAGFTEIYDAGGIQAWQAAGYPVVTD